MNLLQYDASLKDWCHHKSMIIKSYNLSIFSLDNNLSIFHLLQYDHNPEMILPISGLSWDRQGLAHRDSEKNARAKKKLSARVWHKIRPRAPTTWDVLS